MTQAGGGAVQGGKEKRVGTVEVDDGVATGDVKGEGVVKADAAVDLIGGDTCVGYEGGGSDDESLGLGVDGMEGVGVVEGVEDEGAGAAADLVGGVTAIGRGAERVRYRGAAAVGATREGHPTCNAC